MTGLRRAIINCARAQVGTPFHHQGRAAFIGLDCVGLLAHVADALNLFSHDFTAYPAHPDDGHLLTVELGRVCVEIDPGELLPGDIPCFYVSPKSRTPQHVGILIEDGEGIIHAHSQAKRVVETPLGRWRDRIVAGYRFPIVEATWQP